MSLHVRIDRIVIDEELLAGRPAARFVGALEKAIRQSLQATTDASEHDLRQPGSVVDPVLEQPVGEIGQQVAAAVRGAV